MRFGKHDGDGEFERKLRGARPEPSEDLVREISDRVRPRRRGLFGGLGHVPFTAAGGLTGLVLVAVIAIGGFSTPIQGLAKILRIDNQPRKASVHKVKNSATVAQYGSRVNVCVGGYIQLRVYTSQADHLVSGGLGVLGTCSSPSPGKKPLRQTVCLDGYLELRVSDAEFADLTAQHVVVAGKCSKT